MPDMNSNELDDLFKRAAENYPLRTDSADWDKIARALDEDEPSLAIPPVYFRDDKRGRRKFLWLLLLLPLGGIGYYSWHAHFSAGLQKMASKPVDAYQNTIAGKKDNSDNNKPGESPVAASQKMWDNKAAGGQQATIAGKDEKDQGQTVVAGTAGADHAIKNGSLKSVLKNTVVNASANSNMNTRPIRKPAIHSFTSDDQKEPINLFAENNKNNKAGNENTDASKKAIIDLKTDDLSIWGPFEVVVNDKTLKNVSTDFMKPGINGSLNAASGKPAPVKKRAKQSFFYFGIIGAPDFSMVKFQSIKAAGYTAGLLLGYSISPKMALETGIYFDSKKYYTEGEYFSSKNVPFLNYVNLVNVNGSCNMIEVPINLRYNIHSGAKNTWFATTGLSSYFMFKESYDYKYIYNGVDGENYYTYRKSSQNWFSIVNLSAGYEHNLGKIGNLRLEPYLRIPLSGMGTGSLPIMSAGLNVGITHRIK